MIYKKKSTEIFFAPEKNENSYHCIISSTSQIMH